MKQNYLKSFCARCVTLLVLALMSTNLAWGDNATYTKVTSAPTDWSGTYLLAYVNETSAYVYNGTDSGANNGVSATISNNTITSAEGMAEIEIASMTGGYSLKVIGGTNNGKYLSGGTSNGTTFNTNAVANSISLNTDGTVKINNNTTTSFQFNSAKDQQRFRYFKSAQKGVTLFKKESGDDSTPSINASDISIDADATSGEIAYTITNPVDGQSLTAELTTGDWISNVSVDNESGKVIFTSSVNTTTESRDGTITLKYEGATDKVVKITQAGAPYSTISDIFEKATAVGTTATNVEVTFNNWVISGVKNNNAYLTDNNGKGLIIYTSNHGFEVGNILSGTVACKVQLYNGSAELTNLNATTSGLTVTTGGSLTPVEASIADLGGVNTGAYVNLGALTYNGTNFTDGTNTIKPYNAFITLPTLTNGKKYYVKGVYIQFDETKEIAPLTNADFAEVPATEYNITITPCENGYVTVDAENNKAQAGQVVTLTITPETHYALSTLSVTDASSNPVVVTDNKFTMPASDVTVSATFVEKAQYTVTYMSLGTQIGTEQVYDGELCANVPDATNAPTGWTFSGWTTGSAAKTTTVPKLFDPTTDPVIEDITLNAVFTKTEGETSWDETDLADITLSDVFVMVGNDKYAIKNTESTNAGPTPVEVTINEQTIAEPNDNIKWTLSGNNTDGYTFYSKANSEHHLYCSTAATDGSNNNMRVGSGGTNDRKVFVLDDNHLKTKDSYTARYIGINGTSDFRGYVASTTNSVTFKFYKLNAGTTYYTTVRTFAVSVSENAATGLTTMFVDYATEIPEGVEAWYVSAYDATEDKLTMTQIEDYVPANTAIIVKGEAGQSYDFVETFGTVDAVEGNMLSGSVTDYAAADYNVNDGWYYLATSGNFKKYVGENITRRAHKAYLHLTDRTWSQSAKELTIDWGEPTGIKTIDNGQLTIDNSKAYNLNGVRVNENYKGIVIVNGKKYINK